MALEEERYHAITGDTDWQISVGRGGVAIVDELYSDSNNPERYSFWVTKDCNVAEVEDAFFPIVLEIAELFSENRVVAFESMYRPIVNERKKLFSNKWVPPVYNEKGMVNALKEEIKTYGRDKLLWADIEHYAEYDSFLGKKRRWYVKDLVILQEKLDMELLKKAEKASKEIFLVGSKLYIFPHSKIQHQATDEETVRHYFNSKDYYMTIYVGKSDSGTKIILNPEYINYDQLMEVLIPIFAKHGKKVIDPVNPYLRPMLETREDWTKESGE